MNTSTHCVVFLLLHICGVGTLMLALMRYVDIGWKAKRKDSMDGIDKDARLT